MYRKLLLYLSLLTAVFVTTVNVDALSVKARLDSVDILMGRLTSLHLEVVQDEGKPGGFTIFKDESKNGYVGVCGDSVELRTNFHRDTTRLGSGKIQINYDIPLQAFDSGYFQLPEFIYVSQADTARSNRLALKVMPVPVGENDPISDYKGVEEPENKSIFDNVPDWVINYWWIVLILVAAIVAAVWAWKRYRREGSLLPKKPEPTPYESAMAALRNLKSRKLWENGMEKEYFTRLTEILRVYLDRRFGINAMEMTSREIMQTLTDNPEIKDKRDYIRQILSIADFVKFAKVRPLPDDNIAAFDNALKFVEETKPAPVVDSDNNSESDNSKGGNIGKPLKKKGGKS